MPDIRQATDRRSAGVCHGPVRLGQRVPMRRSFDSRSRTRSAQDDRALMDSLRSGMTESFDCDYAPLRMTEALMDSLRSG